MTHLSLDNALIIANVPAQAERPTETQPLSLWSSFKNAMGCLSVFNKWMWVYTVIYLEAYFLKNV